jgi:hypothetical protein
MQPIQQATPSSVSKTYTNKDPIFTEPVCTVDRNVRNTLAVFMYGAIWKTFSVLRRELNAEIQRTEKI